VSEESERILRHRAERMERLLRNEDFLALREEIPRKQERMNVFLLSRLNSQGVSADALQALVEYDRGFVAGMRYIMVEAPEGAVRLLRRQDAQAAGQNEEVKDHWVLK